MAEPVTIAALGDSLTQGYGLPAEDGFVPQLQAWLTAQGADVTLVNAGVSGDTTAGGLSRIDWTLTPEVDAVIVALGGNDVLRGLPPEQAKSNLDAILTKIEERGLPVLLAGIDAPSNYGPDYETEFEAIYTDLAAKHDVLLVSNFLEGLTRIDDRAMVMREHMQSDGIHPDASGVALIVEAVGPVVLSLIAGAKP
ncbi:acyl-CoA thioesterase-1 [Litoreibacter ascidiaceicola]|uniref:Acyl-CoA thioesterase-1 n=2 Tax=Litoreibacter ascidiaceicola TaxID=1486859 RepID=A0A1M4XC81_9RHOB|nr:arylesterase [Litoreibacter ascidiaceicola]SHE91147.1 acyl-CoA thioesterase-1 [Litoreibacter ascidiaceicola]